jgi:hypothetical protein
VPLTGSSIPTPYPSHQIWDAQFSTDGMDGDVCRAVVWGSLRQVAVRRVLTRGLQCSIPIMFSSFASHLTARSAGDGHWVMSLHTISSEEYKVHACRAFFVLRIVSDIPRQQRQHVRYRTRRSACLHSSLLNVNDAFYIQSPNSIPILHNTHALYSLLPVRGFHSCWD